MQLSCHSSECLQSALWWRAPGDLAPGSLRAQRSRSVYGNSMSLSPAHRLCRLRRVSSTAQRSTCSPFHLHTCETPRQQHTLLATQCPASPLRPAAPVNNARASATGLPPVSRARRTWIVWPSGSRLWKGHVCPALLTCTRVIQGRRTGGRPGAHPPQERRQPAPANAYPSRP